MFVIACGHLNHQTTWQNCNIRVKMEVMTNDKNLLPVREKSVQFSQVYVLSTMLSLSLYMYFDTLATTFTVPLETHIFFFCLNTFFFRLWFFKLSLPWNEMCKKRCIMQVCCTVVIWIYIHLVKTISFSQITIIILLRVACL